MMHIADLKIEKKLEKEKERGKKNWSALKRERKLMGRFLRVRAASAGSSWSKLSRHGPASAFSFLRNGGAILLRSCLLGPAHRRFPMPSAPFLLPRLRLTLSQNVTRGRFHFADLWQLAVTTSRSRQLWKTKQAQFLYLQNIRGVKEPFRSEFH